MSSTTQNLMPNAFSSGTGGNTAGTPFSDTGFASIGFVILSASLIMMMTPFVGLLYSGLSSTKNGLSSFYICMVAYSVVGAQWILFGYSLAFAEDSSSYFIGNFHYGAMKGIESQGLGVAPAIPAILYALLQLQFATITAAIIFGSVVERIRFIPSMVFIFIWATVVYCPVAYWTWGYRGWLRNLSCISSTKLDSTPCGLGVFDFAGGGPVEICSGVSALALTLVVGKRTKPGSPHNLVNVNIATGLLWFGWYGFNAGSALSSSPRAAMAAMNTTIAPIFASLAWVFRDYIKSKKITSLSYCSGVLAGLVAITPACGYVPPWAAIVIGVLAGLFSHFLCAFKFTVGYDDTLDAFGVHGGSGFLGLILTGLFASSDIAKMDGTVNGGGGIINGNWIQVGYQAAAAVSILVWCFVVTYLLAFIFSKIPALSLRCTVQDELLGLDYVQLGEKAYELASNAVLGLEEGNLVSRVSNVNLKAMAEAEAKSKVFPAAE